MNIEQTMEQRLVDHGMWGHDTAAVMQAVKESPENAAMRGRWHEDANAYPPQMLAVLWLSVNDHALKWIDANCPRAFYRPMFAAQSAGQVE